MKEDKEDVFMRGCEKGRRGRDEALRGRESSTSPRLSGAFLVPVSTSPQLEGKFTGHHVCGTAPDCLPLSFSYEKIDSLQ